MASLSEATRPSCQRVLPFYGSGNQKEMAKMENFLDRQVAQSRTVTVSFQAHEH